LTKDEGGRACPEQSEGMKDEILSEVEGFRLHPSPCYSKFVSRTKDAGNTAKCRALRIFGS
jgi:hypothetical protein